MEKNKTGFTLIELTVSIVILGIMLGMSTPSFINHLNKAMDEEVLLDSTMLQTMIYMETLEKGDFEHKELSQVEIKGKVYKNGKRYEVENDLGELFKINESYIKDQLKSNLKGIFLLDSDSNLYYAN